MKARLRAMLGLDAVVPVVLIAAAALLSLDPTIFGVAISERAIILGFFGFLGVDALIERSGRLSRIEQQVKTLAERDSGSAGAGEVLRARNTFERMDVLIAQARSSVFIIGVNLEGALQCLSALVELVRSGGTVRLLASDPNGASLPSAAAMSGIDPERRRQKIIQNLQLLHSELTTHLDPDGRSRVLVMIIDQVLPVGAVGLDEKTAHGSLIVQHYLTRTPAEQDPLLWLHPETDEPWYGRYLAQCEACFAVARPWEDTNA
jgi:hypothetical protein